MIHNAFKARNAKFGQRALELSLDVHQRFHMFPARGKEDYSKHQDNMENQDGMDTLTFLRHVDSRWLTLLPTAQMIANRFHYTRSTSRNSYKKMKKIIQSNIRFKSIHKIFNEARQHFEVELCFLDEAKPVWQYLTVLQTKDLLIHVPYPSFLELTKTLFGQLMKILGEVCKEKPGRNEPRASVIMILTVKWKYSFLPPQGI